MCRIYLGVDQSSNVSAYCVQKGGKVLDYGSFQAGKKTDKPHIRINKLQTKLKELIDHWSPDEVIFEDVFKKGSITGFKTLAGCLAVCVNTCVSLGIEFSVVKASSWRKGFITSKKRVDQKQEAIEKVNELFNIKTDSDDEAEAILLSLYKTKEKKDGEKELRKLIGKLPKS